MSLGDAYESTILDLVLGSGHDPAFPATVHLALFSERPTDAGGGTELSGGGYARVAVANNSTQWPDATNGRKTNGAEIAFPEATATWDRAVAFAIMSAATGGNVIIHGRLRRSIVVASGETAKLNPQSLVLICN